MPNFFRHLLKATEQILSKLPNKKLVKVPKLSPYGWEMPKQVRHDGKVGVLDGEQ
jgi:hypothetical protein